MAPTILQGTNAADNFVLGKSGVAFGSSQPTGDRAWDTRNIEDDSIIIGLTPGKDIISLAGTKDDYLIRPTSLPSNISITQQRNNHTFEIFLTDRKNRGRDLGGHFLGNEITSVGFLVMPETWQGTIEDWVSALGLRLDANFNNTVNSGNYYTDTSGKTLRFEGDASPTRSSSPGQVIPQTAERTYSLTPSKTSINEGETLTTTLKTTGVAKNTTLYWEITGSGVDASDFIAAAKTNPLKGEGKVNAKGEFKFSHKFRNDLSLNEGDETLQLKLFSSASRASSSQVGATTTITIVDSSRRPDDPSDILTPKWSALIDTQLWDIQLSQDEEQVVGAGQLGFTAIAAAVSADIGAKQWTSPIGNNYYRATRVEKGLKGEYLVGASATDSNKIPNGAGWQKLDDQGNVIFLSNITNASGKVYGVKAGFTRAGNFIDIFNLELDERRYQPAIRINYASVTGIGTPELLVHCAAINKRGDTVYVAGWEPGNRTSAAVYTATLGTNSVSWSRIGNITTTSITVEELNINSMELDESNGVLVFSGDSQSYAKQSSYGIIGELNISTGNPSIQQVRLSGLMGGGYSTDAISSVKILSNQYLLAAGFESTKYQEVQGKLYLVNRQTKAIESRIIELQDTKWDLVRDIEIDSNGDIFAGGAGLRSLGNISTIFPGQLISPTTSTQASASQDPVTGQQLTFSDLGTIQSDKIYGKENARWLQPIATNLGFTKKEMESLKGFNIEFEFNTQYIAVTMQVKGDTRSQYNLPATYGANWTARWALKGDFEYNNGKLTRAFLKEGAFQVVSQSKQYEGGSATSFYSSATVQDLGKFSSIKAAANYAGNGGTPSGLSANFYPSSDSRSNSSVQHWVRQFGDGNFFYSGWETNPFASNLA